MTSVELTASSSRVEFAMQFSIALMEQFSGFSSIDIFGSVARGEADRSSDVDLIIEVDESEHLKWIDNCRDISGSDHGGGAHVYFGFGASIRLQAAIECIPAIGATLKFLEETKQPVYPVDILILPRDWRYRLDELQRSGEHSDPDFMVNVYRDSRRILIRSVPRPNLGV